MCAILGYCGRGASYDVMKKALEKTATRGPDDSRILDTGNGYLGFNRLAIMDLSDAGMQPFTRNGNAVVCNGEIYDFRELKADLEHDGYTFESGSDCELLLPLWEKYGTGMFRMLDAEYAMILYDVRTDSAGILLFASEPKNLVGICEEIRPFPPGHYYRDARFIAYRNMATVSYTTGGSLEGICMEIRSRLVSGVRKRLDSDAPVGFLLSGGLDSSLVCAIAQKLLPRPIRTFAIGMDKDAIDLKYAREVADFIGSEHHEVIISEQDVLDALEPVIAALGTWDITTIRASIGMYLVCRAIHETSDVRVLLTGEISDELFGYKYTDFAPDARAFQLEAEKRIREIHMYDVLRADRCIAVNSLEARVPFGDLDFVDYVMHLQPDLKMNHYGIGKYLLRHAFEKEDLIPRDILMREKAAFSDAVGHSLKDDLQALAERTYTEEEFEEKRHRYVHAKPFTRESLLYREIFEKYYPGQAEMVADFWMPNRTWPGCDVDDPSARVLSNYGKSGE